MSVEVPPRPEDVIPEQSDLKMAYQAMTALDADEYRRLADDIRENGVLQPVIVDEDGCIIDGHHREALAQHYDLSDAKAPAYVTVAELDDGEKLARGIKQNLIGRDTTDRVKSHAVEQYIETVWDRTDDGDLIRPETNQEVAEKLGVSDDTVGQVVKNSDGRIIYHDRVKAREYYEENPDASYREVSEQVDSSRPTVTEWLKEDFDESDGDDSSDNDQSEEQENEPLIHFSRDAEEREQVNEAVKEATDGGVDTETPTDTESLLDSPTGPEVDDGDDSSDNDDEHTVVDAATKQETDEWSSPRELVEPLDNALGGFDLDPCSGAETSPFAANTYTEEDNGLAQDWFGTVWVNPPYSQMGDWTEKAAAEVARGNADTVLYLCKGDSSTAWWQSGAEQASAICAIDHRLSFGDGGNSAPFASHIFVFGECPDAVVDELAEHGLILRPEVSADD